MNVFSKILTMRAEMVENNPTHVWAENTATLVRENDHCLDNYECGPGDCLKHPEDP